MFFLGQSRAAGADLLSVANHPPSPDHAAVLDACRRHHEMAVAACNGAGLADAVMVLCGYGEDLSKDVDLQSRVEHFRLGEFQEMADLAFAWSQRPGCNVDRSHAVYDPRQLKGKQRGSAAQALGVFGLTGDQDADKGNGFRVDQLPLPATAVCRTSVTPADAPTGVPAVNYQPTYYLDRLATVAEAKLLAGALMQLLGDHDGATGDPAHLWRVPGTLNWPKAAKLKRRRPLQPQLVTTDSRGAGRAVSVEELAAALAVNLQFDEEAADQPTSASAAPEAAQEQRALKWSGDHHDPYSSLSTAKTARIIDALMHISPDVERSIWREVVCALCDYFMGSDDGYALSVAWASGGAFKGGNFPGCPTRYQEASQRVAWEGSRGRGEFSIGTVFHHAKQSGWDASLRRWNLPREQRPARSLPLAAHRVQRIGASMIATGADINELRNAWLQEVAIAADNKPDLIKGAVMVREFINSETGFGFPGYDLLSETLEWGPATTSRDRYVRIQRSVRDIALLGFLVLSPGNQRGAHGRIGVSFALTLPDDMTWQQALVRHKGRFKRPEKRSQHTALGVSPDQIGSGSDTHGPVCVEPRPSSVPHRPMCAHLSPEIAGGRGEGGSASKADTTQPPSPPAQSPVRWQTLDEQIQAGALPPYVVEAAEVVARDNKKSQRPKNLAERIRIAQANGFADGDIHDVIDASLGRRCDPSHPKHDRSDKPLEPSKVLERAANALVRAIGNKPENERAHERLVKRDAHWAESKRQQPAASPAITTKPDTNPYANRKAGEVVDLSALTDPPPFD